MIVKHQSRAFAMLREVGNDPAPPSPIYTLGVGTTPVITRGKHHDIVFPGILLELIVTITSSVASLLRHKRDDNQYLRLPTQLTRMASCRLRGLGRPASCSAGGVSAYAGPAALSRPRRVPGVLARVPRPCHHLARMTRSLVLPTLCAVPVTSTCSCLAKKTPMKGVLGGEAP